MTAGRLIVREAVVEKVAAETARTLPSVSAAGRSLIPMLSSAPQRPKVEVSLSGSVASLKVHLALPFPAPIREITEQARERLRSEVERLTGVAVRYVDIRIADLQVDEDRRVAGQEGGRRWAQLR